MKRQEDWSCSGPSRRLRGGSICLRVYKAVGASGRDRTLVVVRYILPEAEHSSLVQHESH